MNEIGNREIELLYNTAERFHRREITLKEATEILEKENINKNSAVDYLYNYSNLINGKVFTRTMNIPATKYYLEKILKTKGEEILHKSLQSLSLHIDYYESVSGSSVKKKKEILNEFLAKDGKSIDNYFGEELDKKLIEGAVKSVKMNIYERNAYARKKCIEYHGCKCSICSFDFMKVFGKIGEGFIHVHHLLEISEIKKEYKVDYKNDLIPICPNCHAMIHKKKPAFTISELKKTIK